MDPASNSLIQSGLPLVLLAGVAIYIAAKASMDAVMAGRRITGGRLALAQCLPIGVIAVWAAATDGVTQTDHGIIANHHADVAMGIVFGTAVGGLLLAAGAAVLIAPPSPPSGARLLWPMLVPVGLLAFLAGFKGSLTPLNSLALFAEGIVILIVIGPRLIEPVPVEDVNDKPTSSARPWMPEMRVIEFLLAGGVAAIAAYAGLRGIDQIVAGNGRATHGLLTSILLCPLLILPSVGVATNLAQRGKTAEAIEAAVWQAVGNVCLLAPLLLLASRGGYLVRNWEAAKNAHRTGNPIPFAPLPFPVTVWRVDVLFVVAAGLLLSPVALGRWPLTKGQGLGMTVAYGVYLFLPIILQRAAH